MFKLKFAAYNMLNNIIIIIKLISYSWVIIYFENSLYLNLSSSVRFKAKISAGFIFPNGLIEERFGRVDKTVALKCASFMLDSMHRFETYSCQFPFSNYRLLSESLHILFKFHCRTI